jgi:hypothetical protein
MLTLIRRQTPVKLRHAASITRTIPLIMGRLPTEASRIKAQFRTSPVHATQTLFIKEHAVGLDMMHECMGSLPYTCGCANDVSMVVSVKSASPAVISDPEVTNGAISGDEKSLPITCSKSLRPES